MITNNTRHKRQFTGKSKGLQPNLLSQKRYKSNHKKGYLPSRKYYFFKSHIDNPSRKPPRLGIIVAYNPRLLYSRDGDIGRQRTELSNKPVPIALEIIRATWLQVVQLRLKWSKHNPSTRSEIWNSTISIVTFQMMST